VGAGAASVSVAAAASVVVAGYRVLDAFRVGAAAASVVVAGCHVHSEYHAPAVVSADATERGRRGSCVFVLCLRGRCGRRVCRVGHRCSCPWDVVPPGACGGCSVCVEVSVVAGGSYAGGAGVVGGAALAVAMIVVLVATTAVVVSLGVVADTDAAKNDD
jgi:hypothetical protein